MHFKLLRESNRGKVLEKFKRINNKDKEKMSQHSRYWVWKLLVLHCIFLTGWGKMTHPGSSVRFLQQLALTIQDNASCARKNKYTRITDQMLCAANTDVSANQSGCHGDSGGPFVCQNSDGSWTLHGAVSWGSPRCNIKEAYSVFARVGQFRNWIDQKIR